MATAQATPVMDIPAHVPPELVREIGLTTGPGSIQQSLSGAVQNGS